MIQWMRKLKIKCQEDKIEDQSRKEQLNCEGKSKTEVYTFTEGFA